MVEVEGAHRLSPAEREVLRLRVVAALEAGRVEGYRQAAEVFGVSERVVGVIQRGRGDLDVAPLAQQSKLDITTRKLDNSWHAN